MVLKTIRTERGDVVATFDDGEQPGRPVYRRRSLIEIDCERASLLQDLCRETGSLLRGLEKSGVDLFMWSPEVEAIHTVLGKYQMISDMLNSDELGEPFSR